MSEIPPGTPVIVDIGEAAVKVGIAGDLAPRDKFPTIVGREKYQSVMVDTSERVRSAYVGNDAQSMRGVLKIVYPMSRGQVMDWNAFYEVLNHIFYNVLRLDMRMYPVVFSEPILNPPNLREHLAKVFFETYQMPAIAILPSAVMALVNAGLSTGMVVEIGEGMAHVVPILEGEVLTYAVNRLPLGGVDVNENLKNFLMQEGISLNFSAQKEILRDIKEKLCYVAEDLNVESQNAYRTNIRRPYTLPDGTVIQIGNSRFMAPEILFTPGMLGYNTMSITQAIIDSVSKVPPEIKRAMLDNIVLSGGSTKFPGFEKRLERELDQWIPSLGPLPASRTVQKALAQYKPKLVSYDAQVMVPGAPGGGKDTCPECGHDVDTSKDQFCPNCGHQVVTQQIKIKPTAAGTASTDLFGEAEEFVDPDQPTTTQSGSGLVRIISSGDRETATFRGASKLGAMRGVFDSIKITREAFYATPQLIHASILKQIFANI
ncbi:MAG: rod shape-determining protein [Candidatus Lokiarchaeota archaeon]|nr:rod shape-determining protein [Candidatus Lokiarchaeota archaeon]